MAWIRSAWMKINGEGIYGSKAWKVFAKGELVKDTRKPDAPERMKGMPGGKLDQPYTEFKFTTRDFRFTEGMALSTFGA